MSSEIMIPEDIIPTLKNVNKNPYFHFVRPHLRAYIYIYVMRFTEQSNSSEADS